MKIRPLLLALALTLAISPLAAASAEDASAKVQVVSPWARATPAGAQTGAAYMTLVNKGAAADRLVSASTPLAAVTEFHKTVDDNGVMKMLPVDGIEVHAGSQAVLKPGGYHVMLMKLAHPLEVGQSFPLTLTFEKAGTITVSVKVQKIGAMGSDMGNMGHDVGGMKTE